MTARIHAKTLPEQIADWLVQEISEERYAPGDRVPEQAIAEHFDVSRGPVRDALRMVERLGLIRILPRRGAVVPKLCRAEVEELFEIRAALTQVVVQFMTQRATKEEMARLTAMARELKSRVRDREAYFRESNALAAEMIALADSQKLREAIQPVHIQLLRYRHHAFSDPAVRRASAQGYQKIFEAVSRGDVETAQAVMKEMANRLRDRALEALDADLS